MPPRADHLRKDQVQRPLLLLVACAAPVQALLVLAVAPLRHGWPAAVLLVLGAPYLGIVTVAARRLRRRGLDPSPRQVQRSRSAGNSVDGRPL